MEQKESILTKEKIDELEGELNQLRLVKRKEVAEKIKVAMSYGDLSENSEYDEAKNEQAIVEGRILQIETVLKNVKVLNKDEITTDSVNVYTMVTVKNLNKDREEVFTIVGATESDPMMNKISEESPIGKGLLRRKKGDTAEVQLPNGNTVKYTILKIDRPQL